MSDTPSSHGASPGSEVIPLHVPADLYEEVLHFISDRRREQQGVRAVDPRASAIPSPAGDDPKSRDQGPKKDWDDESLREFLDQANEKLKLALVAVASADRPLSSAEIAEASGVPTGRGWGGFLSRAQASSNHRFGRDIPLDGRWNPIARTNDYFLHPDHAEIIKGWADSWPE